MIGARQDEAGYAILAAVVAMAVLALMSLALIDGSRGVTAVVVAGAERARLAAAADAGLAIAVRNLAEPDRSRRWSIDGRPRNARFDGTDLVITIEDERGKVPINQLADEQVRALFEVLGSTGADLDAQTDAFLDWRDDDDEVRANGAEAPYYAPLKRTPRNGALRSVEEIIMIRGMTPAIVARLRATATAYRDQREGFDDRFATPLALSIMSGGGLGSPAVINRERELAGQRVAIDLAETESLVGRPLTIRVVARRPGGSRLMRATVIQLTGRPDVPYGIRTVDR